MTTDLKRTRGMRRGAGLIEVLLAITIFALIATSHAAVTLRYATRVKDVKTGATRSAALQEHIVRLSSVPFDSLPGRAGCVTTTTGDLPNQRCIIVTDVSTVKRTVTLIFRPTRTSIKPDTIFMTRTKSSANPLI
ncbi:MAG: hypothetical protein O2973_04240 [Gemmatimonadetes bacterium]|nr:hypothetical protein [Gemmatimonadota bacterium]